MWEIREWETRLPLEECWRRLKGATEPDEGDDLPAGCLTPALDRVLFKEFGGSFRLRAGRSWIRPEIGPCLYGDFVPGPTGLRIVGQFEPSREAQVVLMALAVFIVLSAAICFVLALSKQMPWNVPLVPLAALGLGGEALRRHWRSSTAKRRRLSRFVESVFEAEPRS